jgi:hypothetical protein
MHITHQIFMYLKTIVQGIILVRLNGFDFILIQFVSFSSYNLFFSRFTANDGGIINNIGFFLFLIKINFMI